MRLTVIGTGYLGAVHAAGLAEMGHEVLGVDIDKQKIDALNDGDPPFFEPGFPELLTATLATGRLRFTTSFAEAGEFGEAHFLCVGTPQKNRSYAADLSGLNAAVESLAPHLQRPCLVIGKSTVPAGTSGDVAARVTELAPAGEGVQVAWNPEFLREGFAVEDTLRPDRLVFGVDSALAEATLREIYAPILAAGTPAISCDRVSAELVKVAANAFLATKISFINAIAEVCEAAGGDVATVAEAIGYDARIGNRFLQAGLGFGGGCLPKDIRAFRARAGEMGAEGALTFLRAIDEINLNRRLRAVEIVEGMLGGSVLSAKIGVLGAAFKPNSDDVRDSPALTVAAMLQLRGADVLVHDPEAIENARNRFPTLDYTTRVEAAFDDADMLLHLTEWDTYRHLDAAEMARRTAVPRMLDARNKLDIEQWRAAGWTVRAMGRPAR
ncbi:UDP-glucose/GDP-mannose dehydrogenase family protein [Gordonia sinesedis]